VHYLRNDSNSGFIHTCNKGAAAARGEYLLFLNNDTEVQSGWLDPLVATLDTDGRAGIAGAKLVYPPAICRKLVPACAQTARWIWSGSTAIRPIRATTTPVPVDHCSGAAILIRAPLFRGAWRLRCALCSGLLRGLGPLAESAGSRLQGGVPASLSGCASSQRYYRRTCPVASWRKSRATVRSTCSAGAATCGNRTGYA
jgi:hypothetical protein